MTTTVECSESARLLIDNRLDTIDRMLLGRMSRQDRLAIAREVEIQIQELLDQRGRDEITREDVLEVLSRLDPPEAFLPDGEGYERRSPRAAEGSRSGPVRAARAGTTARVAGWLGIAAIVLGILGPWIAWALSVTLQNVFLLFGVGLLSAISSVVLAAMAVALGVYGRREGAWAIVGIATGVMTALTLVIELLLIWFLCTI